MSVNTQHLLLKEKTREFEIVRIESSNVMYNGGAMLNNKREVCLEQAIDCKRLASWEVSFGFSSLLRQRVYIKRRECMRLSSTLSFFPCSAYSPEFSGLSYGFRDEVVGWNIISPNDIGVTLILLFQRKVIHTVKWNTGWWFIECAEWEMWLTS